MAKDFPILFFAPPPGAWQLVFWAFLSLFGFLPAYSFLTDPLPNVPGAIVSFATAVVLAGFGVATYFERRLRRRPALTVTQKGLDFWLGSSREQCLPWEQLDKIWITGGSDSQLVFQPKDLRRYGRRSLLVLRAGPSVPLQTATKAGLRLTEVIESLWDEARADFS